MRVLQHSGLAGEFLKICGDSLIIRNYNIQRRSNKCMFYFFCAFLRQTMPEFCSVMLEEKRQSMKFVLCGSVPVSVYTDESIF